MSTVLVVDDNVMDRKIFGTYLKQAGFTVFNAQNAEEAMEQVTRHPPNLIVLDVVMEGKSGFEVCRKLKTDQHTKAIPVMICSFKSTDADKLWGEAVGADAYLGKPVDQGEFIKKVWQLLAR